MAQTKRQKAIWFFLKTALAILFFSFAFQTNALTVSPPRIELEGDRGTVLSNTVKIYNEGEVEETFYISYENFEAKGETGTPSFVKSVTGLATWITTEPSVTLQPREDRKVPFSILIPNDADPGGHFAAIFFGVNPPSDGAQLSVGAQTGPIVLLRVRGDIKEEGGVLEFGAEKNKKYYNTLPVNFYYRFQNSGNDRIKPIGEVKIKNMLGFNSARPLANPQEGNILPHSIRRFSIVWGDDTGEFSYLVEDGDNLAVKFWKGVKREWYNFGFGRYKAHLNIIYGSKDTMSKSFFVVYVLPWRITLITIVVLVIVFWFGRHEIRKYNEWIISKAMGHVKAAHEAIKRGMGRKI